MSSIYEKILESDSPPLPMILDEKESLHFLSVFLWELVSDFETAKYLSPGNVFLYEKDEDKKFFTIDRVRRFLAEISEKPYIGKAVYLLKWFDQATIEAQNACLKILEEPPEYALILLIVEHPEKILDTLHSRTVNFFRWTTQQSSNPEYRSMVQDFLGGKPLALLGYLASKPDDQYAGLSILLELIRLVDTTMDVEIATQGMIEILNVNEPVYNILESVFFRIGDKKERKI